MATAAQKKKRDVLREYLRQYNNARQRKHDLEQRLHEVMAELNNPPLGGQHRDAQRSGKPTAGAASVAFKIDDIEQRIKDQQAEMARTLSNVLDILDLLPEASTTRSILEQRCIDGKKWSSISDHSYISRSRCAELENEALDQLLGFEKVGALVYQLDPELWPSAT